MKDRTDQFNLFVELGLGTNAPPEPTPAKRSAREEHRGHVMIETMLKCFSNPTIYCKSPTSAIPPPHDWLKQNRMMIELERAARLMQLLKDKPEASLDEIRACATILTNYEKCGVLSVISGLAPPGHEMGAEYMRAFSRCCELEKVLELWSDLGDDPIHLSDVERFYQLYGGQGNWGWLDDRERAWIRDFNDQARARRSKVLAKQRS